MADPGPGSDPGWPGSHTGVPSWPGWGRCELQGCGNGVDPAEVHAFWSAVSRQVHGHEQTPGKVDAERGSLLTVSFTALAGRVHLPVDWVCDAIQCACGVLHASGIYFSRGMLMPH